MINYKDIEIKIEGLPLEELLAEGTTSVFDSVYAYHILLLFIILRNSPIFENFLLYKNKDITKYIKSIEIIRFDEDPKMIKVYDPESKQLKLSFGKTVTASLRVMRNITKPQHSEEQDIHKILTKEINLRDIELTYGRLSINTFVTPLEEYSLDFILKDIKEFEEIPSSIKIRLLNQVFTTEIEKAKYSNESLKTFFKETTSTQIQRKIKHLDDRMKEHYDRISSYNNTIASLFVEVQRLISEKEILSTAPPTNFNIEKLPKNIIEVEYNTDNKSIIFYTLPIILSFDNNKIKNIPNKKIQNYAEKNYFFCIGYHKIIVSESLNLTFLSLNGYLNYHIESYNCYGTYHDHILEAQKTGNLQNLLSLADRILSSATIGDFAGNSTIENSLVIDQEGFVIEDLKAKKTYENTHYLDLLKKGIRENASYRAFL